MTYSESFPYYITHADVVRVLTDHYLLDDISDFYSEYGQHLQYKSKDVLNWLGY